MRVIGALASERTKARLAAAGIVLMGWLATGAVFALARTTPGAIELVARVTWLEYDVPIALLRKAERLYGAAIFFIPALLAGLIVYHLCARSGRRALFVAIAGIAAAYLGLLRVFGNLYNADLLRLGSFPLIELGLWLAVVGVLFLCLRWLGWRDGYGAICPLRPSEPPARSSTDPPPTTPTPAPAPRRFFCRPSRAILAALLAGEAVLATIVLCGGNGVNLVPLRVFLCSSGNAFLQGPSGYLIATSVPASSFLWAMVIWLPAWLAAVLTYRHVQRGTLRFSLRTLMLAITFTALFFALNLTPNQSSVGGDLQLFALLLLSARLLFEAAEVAPGAGARRPDTLS